MASVFVLAGFAYSMSSLFAGHVGRRGHETRSTLRCPRHFGGEIGQRGRTPASPTDPIPKSSGAAAAS